VKSFARRSTASIAANSRPLPTVIYRRVILPQAVRIAVPPLGNVFIGLLKGATIMAVIAVPDMVLVAMRINTANFTPFEAFTGVLVILVTLVFILSGLLHVLERRLRHGA
jgi:ABC-type amino acid transport system permease subunit